MLTAYDGKSISYDSIGNPTRYYNGSQMRWVGRQLDTLIYADGNSCMYDYNADGIRVEKVISGKETHKYLLEGDRIIREEILDKNGARKHLLWYNYDGNGQLTSVEYDGNKYLYKVNQMGDVLGLYNTAGALVVKYRYDAWGKLLEVKTGNGTVITDPENVGLRNPFRYRGYYYDADTGFYYLNARYYDPETGRFINADGYASTGQGFVGSNMFAYCNNNPVMYADYTGSMPCGAAICFYPDQRSHSIDTCRMLSAQRKSKSTSKASSTPKTSTSASTTWNRIDNTANTIVNSALDVGTYMNQGKHLKNGARNRAYINRLSDGFNSAFTVTAAAGVAIETCEGINENYVNGASYGKIAWDATVDTVVLGSNVMVSAAAGAFIGSLIPVPVVGTLLGTLGGALVGWVLDELSTEPRNYMKSWVQ